MKSSLSLVAAPFWGKLLLSALAGASAASAFAPFTLLGVLLFSFPLTLLLLRQPKQVSARRSERPRSKEPSRWRLGFGLGWAFGTAHFLAGLFWVGESFWAQNTIPLWLAPFAVILLALFLGLFPALAFGIATRFPLPGVRGALWLATTWVACEWLRSVLFGGFAWNLLGDAWLGHAETAQLAAWVGVWGLSFLAVLFGVSPLLLVAKKHRFWGLLFFSLPLLLWTFGALRLPQSNEIHPESLLRIVQPSIPQKEKWLPQRRDANIETLVRLSRTPGSAKPTHVFWGETALPVVLSSQNYQEWVQPLATQVATPEAFWVFGTVWQGPKLPHRDAHRVTNRMLAVNAQGGLLWVYDKKHLTPFGETMPWPEFFPRPLAWPVGFTPGAGDRVALHLPLLPPVSPLICYEIIFPGQVRTPEAQWILNLTNDAWFGDTPGPQQHFASARMRAIEEGIPVVRVANTGVSGLIDPFGRVLARMEVGDKGVLDVRLPKPAPKTFFSRVGNALLLVLVLFSFVLWEKPLRRRIRKTL